MTPNQEAKAALDIAIDNRIKAGVYAQMGFTELARFLRRNADAAERWAAKRGTWGENTRQTVEEAIATAKSDGKWDAPR